MRSFVCMFRDLDLIIEDMKEDGIGVQSKDLFHYLMSRSHSNEDILLVDTELCSGGR